MINNNVHKFLVLGLMDDHMIINSMDYNPSDTLHIPLEDSGLATFILVTVAISTELEIMVNVNYNIF